MFAELAKISVQLHCVYRWTVNIYMILGLMCENTTLHILR